MTRVLLIDHTNARRESIKAALVVIGCAVEAIPEVWGTQTFERSPSQAEVQELLETRLRADWDAIFLHIHNHLGLETIRLLDKSPVLEYSGGSIEPEYRDGNPKHAIYEKPTPIDAKLADWNLPGYLDAVAKSDWQKAVEVLNGYDPVLEAKLTLLYSLLGSPLALTGLDRELDVLGDKYGAPVRTVLKPFEGSTIPTSILAQVRDMLLGS